MGVRSPVSSSCSPMSGSPTRVVLFDNSKDLREVFRMLVDAQPASHRVENMDSRAYH
jgi:hypothetical protein